MPSTDMCGKANSWFYFSSFGALPMLPWARCHVWSQTLTGNSRETRHSGHDPSRKIRGYYFTRDSWTYTSSHVIHYKNFICFRNSTSISHNDLLFLFLHSSSPTLPVIRSTPQTQWFMTTMLELTCVSQMVYSSSESICY